MNEGRRLVTLTIGAPAGQPDPYVIFSRGKYYLYATGAEGVAVYESEDLSDFIYRGTALSVTGQKEYWAPCVVEDDEKYYMYYSSMSTDTDDVHMQRLKVAVSADPLGKFEYVCDLLPPFSIDAHVVKNGAGERFLFYSLNDYDAARAGTYIAVDRMPTSFSVARKPVAAVVPTLNEEIFQRNRFKAGQHWHTVEGAFYFFADGTHFLMYSGNCYQKPEYYIGYATAKGSADDDLTKVKFKKYPDELTYAPLLSKSADEEGTGHNSIITAGDKRYIVYHARDIDIKTGEDNRTARIRTLEVNGGKLNKGCSNPLVRIEQLNKKGLLIKIKEKR